MGAGGEYPLDPEQYLEVGETRSFGFEPDEGYQLIVDSTCHGERVGNTYTVTANRDNCRLDATFSLEAFQSLLRLLLQVRGANSSPLHQ